uniref:Uncharacterized protein n=1 Tax=Parascaris univalens TaxID=6257 RepID=A0A915BEZ6_PARUN
MHLQLVMLIFFAGAVSAQLSCGMFGFGCSPCAQSGILPNVALNKRVAAALSEFGCYPGIPYWLGGASTVGNVPIVGNELSNYYNVPVIGSGITSYNNVPVIGGTYYGVPVVG